MQPPITRCAIRRGQLWLSALALFALGCGLSDYEKRIDEQKKKLERVDQEGKLIAEPLASPPYRLNEKKEQVLGLPLEFFFRPPRGISRTPEPAPYAFPAKGPNQVFLYRYPTAKPEKSDPKTERPPLAEAIFLTTSFVDDRPEHGLTLEEFKKNVIGALNFGYLRNTEVPVKQMVQKKHQAGPLLFEVVELPGGLIKEVKDPKDAKDTKDGKDAKGKSPKERYLWHFSVCFHHEKSITRSRTVQAAIVFQVPYERRDEETVRKAQDASLRSLGIGDEQDKKQAAYYLGRRH